MNLIKRKRKRRMPRPTLIVHWPKGDDGKARLDRAIEIAGGNASSVIRGLADAWADLILARNPSDIQSAAETIARSVEADEEPTARVAEDGPKKRRK